MNHHFTLDFQNKNSSLRMAEKIAFLQQAAINRPCKINVIHNIGFLQKPDLETVRLNQRNGPIIKNQVSHGGSMKSQDTDEDGNSHTMKLMNTTNAS